MVLVMEVETISAELAIRRELAYREKVAAFMSEEEIAALLPLEVPSPKTQDEAPLLALEGPKYDEVENCEINPNAMEKSIEVIEISSDIEIHSSEVPLLALEGPKPEDEVENRENTLQVKEEAGPSFRLQILEKKREELLPSGSNTFQNHSRRPYSDGVTIGFHPKPDGSAFFCHLCKVDCTSSLNYKSHVRGHKHKAKLKYGQLTRNSRSKKRHFPCEVCEIWCEDEDSLRLHLNGRKHKVKLLDANLADQQ